jgi:SEC-C motif-containing protein
MNCPCNSKKLFSVCCEPYLSGKQKAPTPESLMRSRYTAYSLARIDYIQTTMCKKAAENYDPADAAKWASSVTWLGLTVIDAPPPKNHIGTVTFIARFLENNIPREITEKSLFEKINGVWFYVDSSL